MSKYTVTVYNEFGVQQFSKVITADNVAVGETEYVFVKFNEETGNFDTVAIIDRTAERAIDVIME